jgi:leucyl-tRNA synthetase
MWNEDGVVGTYRFLEKVWRSTGTLLENTASTTTSSPEVTRELHKTIKKVGEDVADMRFNTAISQMMIFMNTVTQGSVSKEDFTLFLKVLAPFAPHLTEELWEALGQTTSIHREKWPRYDETKLAAAEVTIAVQVNGKVRGTFTTPPDTDKETLTAQAKELPRVAEYLQGGEVVKEIVVPNRLVNIVVRSSPST